MSRRKVFERYDAIQLLKVLSLKFPKLHFKSEFNILGNNFENRFVLNKKFILRFGFKKFQIRFPLMEFEIC